MDAGEVTKDLIIGLLEHTNLKAFGGTMGHEVRDPEEIAKLTGRVYTVIYGAIKEAEREKSSQPQAVPKKRRREQQ